MTRESLTSNRTYYVRSDGNDSSDGLTNSSGGAFLTLQKAADIIQDTLDLSGYVVTVQVGTGSYSAGFQLNGGIPGNESHESILVTGDIATPSNVTINCGTNRAFFAYEGGKFTVRGFKCAGTGGGSGGMGLRAEGAGSIIYCDDKMEYGTLGAGISAERGGLIFCVGGNYTISGAHSYHAAALQKGHVVIRNLTVTITGNPAWGACFANSDRQGLVEIFSNTYSGASTGKRYVADGGDIFVFGAGTGALPGNVAGTTDHGGQYY